MAFRGNKSFVARRIALAAAFGGALIASGSIAACEGVESGRAPAPGNAESGAPTSDSSVPTGDQENLGQAREALSASEVLTRAQEWVDDQVPYCGGVNGGTDYICGGTCNRPSAPWDNYRTDCSGFVSWCWEISSDPTTSSYMNDNGGANGWNTINIDDLQPGDAMVCDGHIKLFSKWVSATSAEIYEEYNCGHVARKAVQSFTRSGNHMYFQYDNREYHPIRRNGITPLAAVKGYLDSASVYLKGWAVDTSDSSTPLSVDLSLDDVPGKGFTFTTVASDPRPDVGDSLGIDPNHGFNVLTPLFYCDGADHTAYASGHALVDGALIALTNSPKTFTCPVPVSPKGLLRHVATPDVLDAWAFSRPVDERWMTAEDRATHDTGADWPTTPRVGKTSDGAVYVVDGKSARHVVDPASLAAWRFDTSKIEAWSASDFAAFTIGLDLPATPVLVQQVGDPAVYVLDADEDAPAPTTTSSGTGTPTTSTGTGSSGSTHPTTTSGGNATATGSSGGCAVDSGATTGSAGAMSALVLIGLALGARSKRRPAA